MHELHTEIEIAGTPEQVWAILTDFGAYPRWNPFIRSIEGALVKGASLKVRVEPSGGKAMTFRPKVLVAEAPRELRWLGQFLIPGIYDGDHRCVIEPLQSGKVLFKHSERFDGLLIPLFRTSLDRDTKRGLVEMNVALKQQVEGKGK
jgi:hypothetical protein